ncbi:mRNA (2'-O-methyladenosine-N(6)-)-methyltransferase isoform X3 [Syngnathus scovelli]|uniref:mRNA (2'-O-methyladenosine-N(6)-)-methyltransferase isoform X3 n=1 Tax=Syngnathus scovelli TaxID=161590 RepID=UPI002110ADC5|nr:mRNA (2'-O-methyladenosine-N(6)-)-methyltransferase isoform X3 [Syngnathus scovelli]
MSNESRASLKGEGAMVHSPGASAASHVLPLSPSAAAKPPELPDELIQAGWSKCWSRRENRPYYFNRFTNQSLWEVPVLGQHDVISDPLGLNAAPTEGADGNLGNGQRKKRSSEEQAAGPNSLKRAKVEPTMPISPSVPSAKPWSAAPDDKRGTAAVAPGTPSPTPAIYKPTVASNVGLHLVMSCMCVCCPSIYWDLDIQTNAVIREQPLAQHLPPHPEIELQRAQLVTKLRQHYHELCHQREGIDPPRESFNRWLLERKVLDKGWDPMLPSDCEPVISPCMFREVMNDIPIRLSRIKYKEEARKLLFKYAEAAKKMIDSRNASPESRKVVKWNAEDTMSWLRRDHSASKEDYMDRLEHLRQQCGPHVTAVAKDSVEGICSKIYQLSSDYCRRLRHTHLSLLQDPPADASASSSSPPPLPASSRLVYCYPLRLAQPSPSLPRVELHFENDVACLRFRGEMVKVNRGHFSKLELLYRYSCIDDSRFEKFLSRVWCLLKRYQDLLEQSSEPLSFIVFVPEWRDPVTPALGRMEASRFLRHQMSVPAYEHEYRSGTQHICKREEMYYRAVHGTAVLFLQNAAGFAKWPPTPERLAELTASYRPSRSTPAAGPPPLASPGPAHLLPVDRDASALNKAGDRVSDAHASPGGHDKNNNGGSPQEKMAAV